MKIWTNGSRFFGAQLDRIEDGFRALGHEITPYIDLCDIAYSNNDHAQIVADKTAGRLKPGAKVILTCLDVPEHLLPQFDLAPLRDQLSAADAVCTISQFGQSQVQRFFGLVSHVVYQPIKPVHRDPSLKVPFPRFLSASRRSDANKRYHLAVQALHLLGYGPQDVALVGNETHWGAYIGVIGDEDLNIAYNSADFAICTGRIEGLCLGVLESMAAGTVPIICNDLSTRHELLPPTLFPEYNEVDPNPTSIARFIARLVNEDSGERLAELKERLHAHYIANWADKVSPVGVARAILNVYESIT